MAFDNPEIGTEQQQPGLQPGRDQMAAIQGVLGENTLYPSSPDHHSVILRRGIDHMVPLQPLRDRCCRNTTETAETLPIPKIASLIHRSEA
jgi:hypothetical protein